MDLINTIGFESVIRIAWKGDLIRIGCIDHPAGLPRICNIS